MCGCWVLYRVPVQQLAACRPMLAVQPLYRPDPKLAEALAPVLAVWWHGTQEGVRYGVSMLPCNALENVLQGSWMPPSHQHGINMVQGHGQHMSSPYNTRTLQCTLAKHLQCKYIATTHQTQHTGMTPGTASMRGHHDLKLQPHNQPAASTLCRFTAVHRVPLSICVCWRQHLCLYVATTRSVLGEQGAHTIGFIRSATSQFLSLFSPALSHAPRTPSQRAQQHQSQHTTTSRVSTPS